MEVNVNIALDTNLLYHLTELAFNNKINNTRLKEILTNNKVFITEYSLIEFISTNRNEYSKVKKFLEFIFKNNYHNNIIGESHINLLEILFSLYKPRPVDNVLYYTMKIHEKRIEIETEFIRMYIFTFIALALTSIENTYEVDEVELNLLAQEMIFIKDDFIDLIQDKLRHIYSADNKISADCSDLFDSIYVETLSMLVNQIRIEDRYLIRLKALQKSPLSLIVKGNKLDYTTKLRSELTKYFMSRNIKKYHQLYILRKIEIMLKEEESRFKKNDIFDMLILNCALTKGMPIITVDAGCIGYLKDINNQESLTLIKQIGCC